MKQQLVKSRQEVAYAKCIERVRKAKLQAVKPCMEVIKKEAVTETKSEMKGSGRTQSLSVVASHKTVKLEKAGRRSEAAEERHKLNQRSGDLFVQSFAGPVVGVEKVILTVLEEPTPSETCEESTRLSKEHSLRIQVGNTDKRSRQFLPAASEAKVESVCLLKGKRSWDMVESDVAKSTIGVKCELNQNAEFKHVGNIDIGKSITHCWSGPTLKQERLKVILASKPSEQAPPMRSKEACLMHIKRQKLVV